MKTVLITGANKSIGFETARQLLKAGYYVYLGSRDIENGKKAVQKLNDEGFKNLEALQIDISDPQFVKAAREVLGEKITSLDVLINNAGISGGFPQPPTTIDVSAIRKVFDTNFFGTIDVTQTFLDLLKKADEPRIVNVTSGLASLTLHSDPSWKFFNFKGGAYGPSKTALNAYTIALAHELRDTTFKINAIDPGFTATDFNNNRGTGNVHDAAALIVKYATIDAGGPTGKYFSNDMNTADKESPW
ncbi:MAG TPA: SDR family NAD(P)-dependent oxidoreductase [Mucilaginibacter sp.]|nr:SDR family NAD(P)-dependent oxidoreductase [Mucilaginibacter sp.]